MTEDQMYLASRALANVVQEAAAKGEYDCLDGIAKAAAGAIVKGFAALTQSPDTDASR